tara:strand:+ start:40 stop:966 length:927 start_codon:yes stop_codon:yes gene_type:complete
MALSTPISLTAVRDFFGLTGNINLTNLHRGESNIINVGSTYGSSTVGSGSSVTTPVGSIGSGSNYMVNGGSHTPHTLYPYGGVCPSLSTANTGIADDGESINLTDYVGAYRKVTPTASYVGSTPVTSQGSHTGLYRGVSSPIDNPVAYKSWCGINYETLHKNPNISGFDVTSYCQLLTMQSNQYDSFSTGSMTVNFTLSHAGIYTVHVSVTGNGGSNHFVNISGTGVSIFDHAGVQHTAGQNITLNAGLPVAFHRLLELHHTSTSSTITLVCGGTGGAVQTQIRTNTNYLRATNTTNYTVYNDMFTQS